jgi:hypothetical protein
MFSAIYADILFKQEKQLLTKVAHSLHRTSIRSTFLDSLYQGKANQEKLSKQIRKTPE